MTDLSPRSLVAADSVKPVKDLTLVITFDGSGTTFDPLYIKEFLFPAFKKKIEELTSTEIGEFQTFEPDKVFNTSFKRRAKKEFDALKETHQLDIDFKTVWNAAKGDFREILKDPEKGNKVAPVYIKAIQEVFKKIDEYKNKANIITAAVSNLSSIEKDGRKSPLKAQFEQFFKQHDLQKDTFDSMLGAANSEERKPNTFMMEKLYEEHSLTDKDFLHIHIGDGYSDMEMCAKLADKGININFILTGEESIKEFNNSISSDSQNQLDIPEARKKDWKNSNDRLKGKISISNNPQELPSKLEDLIKAAIKEQSQTTQR